MRAACERRATVTPIQRQGNGWGRSTRDVLDDHLHRLRNGDLEGDIRANYHPDVCLLSTEGIHHGHNGVRILAGILRTYLPHGNFHYRRLITCGEAGMLRWSGRSARASAETHDGANSYVVRCGLIVAQTVHHSAPAWKADS